MRELCSGPKEGLSTCHKLPRGHSILAKKGRKSGRQPVKQTEVSRKRAIAQARAQDERVSPAEALMTPG